MKVKPYYLKIQPGAMLLALLFFMQPLFAQTLQRPVAAPYISFGACSLNHLNVFSFISNQAALAQVKNMAAGVYGERRFMLNELNTYTAVFALPTQSGNFGLKTNYSGFSDYNETQLGLAYARKLGTKVDIGVQFNYNSIRVSGYGNASAISFEAGSLFHITDKLHTGFHVSNPVGGRFGKEQQEKLPSAFTAGFGYDASEKFFFSIELVKEEDQPINAEAGLQYKMHPRLLIRTGISSASSSAWMGFGFLLKSFRLDASASYHPLLGITPGLLLVFNLNKKENE
jgi:hypothetical protein